MQSRIGMLTPSSNTVLEPVTTRLGASLAARLTVHFSRFRVTVISDAPHSHEQFEFSPMLEAARLLADARVDVIVWNGTSGAWEGLDKDRALSNLIQSETSIPATTATLALLDAFQKFHVRRFGLVVPYTDAITERIKVTLRAAGFACVAATNERLSTNFEFAEVSPDLLASRVRQVAQARPDAVVIHCTNLNGAGIVQELEEELGIPVIDSVAVAFWGALRCLNIDTSINGYGSLLNG